VDSCIYLNLWKKEGNAKFGTPYWKIAENFFEKFKDSVFYYSDFLLKELTHKMEKKSFSKLLNTFKDSQNFEKLKCSPIEFRFARKIESELKYEIGFYDILHLLLAKQADAFLITRDRKLLGISKK